MSFWPFDDAEEMCCWVDDTTRRRCTHHPVARLLNPKDLRVIVYDEKTGKTHDLVHQHEGLRTTCDTHSYKLPEERVPDIRGTA